MQRLGLNGDYPNTSGAKRGGIPESPDPFKTTSSLAFIDPATMAEQQVRYFAVNSVSVACLRCCMHCRRIVRDAVIVAWCC